MAKKSNLVLLLEWCQIKADAVQDKYRKERQEKLKRRKAANKHG